MIIAWYIYETHKNERLEIKDSHDTAIDTLFETILKRL